MLKITPSFSPTVMMQAPSSTATAPSVSRLSRHRHGLGMMGVLTCLLALLACGTSSAQAVTTLPSLTKFEMPLPANPEEASGDTEISGGVGVYEASHEVYAGDASNERVLQFGALGAFTAAFGEGVDLTTGGSICTESSGDVCGMGHQSYGAGGFVDQNGVTVDQATGDVYIADAGSSRVQEFNAEGEFLLMFGKGVNKNGGDVCTASEAADCQQGTKLAVGESGEGFHGDGWDGADGIDGHVAIGSSGTVYVGDLERVEKFSPAGVYEGEVALPGTGIDYGLAVDGAGDLYVIGSNAGGGVLTEGVSEYSPAGVKLRAFGSASGNPLDVAVQEGTGDVYVLEEASEQVSEFSPTGALVAQSPAGALVRPEYPTNGALAVTSEGTVYVTNGTRVWKAVYNGNGAPIGKAHEGALDVVVFGSPPPVPPSVSREGVVKLGVREAEVEAEVNPDLRETTFAVEYGLTESYGQTLSGSAVGEDLAEHRVAVKLGGLESGLTYHYRFVAKSSAGVTYGPDRELTTYPSPLVGLPDGRVYELVSEEVKYGHEAGADTSSLIGQYALARPDGSGVLYQTEVGQGQTETGLMEYAVARDGGDGWSSSSAVPQGHTPVENPELASATGGGLVPSSDLERVVFLQDYRSFYGSPEAHPGGSKARDLYRALTDGGLSEPEWLSEPQVAKPLPEADNPAYATMVVAGASPDLGTVFFGYTGTLVPEDSGRAAHIGSGAEEGKPWGFYEVSPGVGGEGSSLSSAGVLPSTGRPSPWGAAPANIAGNPGNYGRELGLDPATADNDVAVDGSRADALFVSPDPNSEGSCRTAEEGAGKSAQKVKEVCTPQLYLREGTERTVLVSRSMLTGGQAADGAVGVAASSRAIEGGGTVRAVGYGFQSVDGSRVFFQSTDRLTADAPESAVAKEYVFDVETEVVSYVPGVVGSVVGASPDGSRVLFLEATTSQEESNGNVVPLSGRLVLWSEGSTSLVANVPAPQSGGLEVSAGRVIGSGPAVVVFQADSALRRSESEALNDGGGYQQVFRWSASEGLVCVSCAPWGVSPSGNAFLSHDAGERGFLVENDGVSEDGSRVFFDTPSPLVSSDVNGVSDVYEWEAGHVYLISGGRSPYPSFFMDSSANGDDVFFTTAEGLVPGDTDGGYDVYDARIGGHAPIEPESGCMSGCRGTGEGAPGPLVGLTGTSGPSGNLLGAPAPVVSSTPKSTPAKTKKTVKKHKRKKNKERKKTAKHRRAGRSARRVVRGGGR